MGFPPVLQLAFVVLLGAYLIVSVLARLVPGWRGVWRDRSDVGTLDHFLEYTLVPALVWMAAVAAVVVHWDDGAPLDGGWTITELTVGPAAVLLGTALIVAVSVQRRKHEGGETGETADPAALRSWLPLLLMLLGMGTLAAGAWTLGRTVKSRAARSEREPQSPSPRPAVTGPGPASPAPASPAEGTSSPPMPEPPPTP
jgi:hypothetical protein